MNLLIFDMDGTLTPARELISEEMTVSLLQILQFDKIMIISGSDIDYMSEQLKPFLDKVPKEDSWKLSIMPLNGTKKYGVESSSLFELSSLKTDMISEIGIEDYRALIRIILQIHVSNLNRSSLTKNIPMSGTFLQFRGTTLNYCPIGRDSNHKNRKLFEELDKKEYIREQILYQIEQSLFMLGLNNQVEIVLGGKTSFDIYPRGWSKIFGIKDINTTKYKKIMFFGDHCDKNQNDHTIFVKIGRLENGKSFWVKNEEETEQILEHYFYSEYQS